jgi:predicted ATPase
MTTQGEVHVLGKLTVTFADEREPVTKFRTRKAALLLIYLALHQGKMYSRDFLIDLLWPEASLESGRSNLSTTLSILRRQLEVSGQKRFFEADHTTVRLCNEGLTVDARRFEALVQRGLNRRLESNIRQSALKEALALWESPLPGIYDDWACNEQTRLQSLADQATEAFESLPPSEGENKAETEDATPSLSDGLPLYFSRFFGRESDIATLSVYFSTTRIITLVGPGGMGKTRLSLEVARANVHLFAKTLFISLAELPSAVFLLPTLRRAITSDPPSADPLAQVVETINTGLGRVLIILDNIEHLLSDQNDKNDESDKSDEKNQNGAVWLVKILLERCPRLTILATSRQALGLEGEQQYPVEPLASEASVALFMERGRAVRPDFTQHAGNTTEIATICQRLEGLPLGLELAAAWVRVLPLAALRERLEGEMYRLSGRRHDLLPRQQSLEATILWSWELLTKAQQSALTWLSIIPGPFSLSLACDFLATSHAFALLSELEARSLLSPTAHQNGWRLLEPLRQFARGRLEEAGNTDIAFSQLVDTLLARAKMGDSESTVWLDAREEELDALRSALSWGSTHDIARGQRLAEAIWMVWEMRGHLAEGNLWMHRLDTKNLDAKNTNQHVSTEFLCIAATLSLRVGDSLVAEDLAARAIVAARQVSNLKAELKAVQILLNIARSRQDGLERAYEINTTLRSLAEQVADPNILIGVYIDSGLLELNRGDMVAAQTQFEAAIPLAQRANRQRDEARAWTNLGLALSHQNNQLSHQNKEIDCQDKLERATECQNRALALAEAIHDLRIARYAISGLGLIALEQKNTLEAEAYFIRALQTSQKIGLTVGIWEDLNGLARTWLSYGDAPHALRLLGAIDRMREEHLLPVLPVIAQAITEARETCEKPERADEKSERADALWQSGQLMTTKETIDWVLDYKGVEKQ